MTFSEFAPIAILLFLAFLCITIAIILAIKSKKSRLSFEKNDFIDDFITKKKRALNANLGGISWRDYISLLIIAPISFGIVSYTFLSSKALCIVFVAIGLFVPELFIRLNANKQKKKFEERYSLALRTLSSSLRAGKSIEQAIDDVGNSIFVEEHIRAGFRQISADIKVGLPIEKAFYRFAEECNSKDAYDVAAAITMQTKVGGSEAMTVSLIAQNINERLLNRKEINALFADTDMLILAMDFIPWVILMLLYIFAPQFIMPFFDSFPMTMLLVGLMSIVTVGTFILRRLAKKAKEG